MYLIWVSGKHIGILWGRYGLTQTCPLEIHICPLALVYSTSTCIVKTTSKLATGVSKHQCAKIDLITWLISYLPLKSISCHFHQYLPSSVGHGQIWVVWAGYGFVQGRYSRRYEQNQVIIYIRIYVCMCILCMYMYVCMYVWMDVWMYGCMYVYV